jgi:UDP-glucose 4-epimerase
VAAIGDVGRRFAGWSGYSAELQRWLTYGRVLDTAKLATELTWRPKYSTEAAFADYVQAGGLGGNLPLTVIDRLAGVVGGIRR